MSESNTQNKLISNIQFLLYRFKANRKVENASFQFSSNPTVYELESQLPELWLRSRNPIDKNLAFYSDQILNLPENKFPITQFIIPMESSFTSKEVSICKIDLDQLFGKSPLEAKKEDLSLEGTLKRGHTHHNEDKKVEHQMKTKKWYLNFPNNVYYGPYSGEEIYMFIKNISKSRTLKNLNFMVADSESDYYFKPEAIFELLSEDLKLRNEDVNIEKKLEKACEAVCGNSEKKYFVERLFSDKPKLMTKFDVAEMKSKYKNALNIDIIHLNRQLINMKKLERNKENLGYLTNLNTPSSYFSNKFSTSRNNKFDKFSVKKKKSTSDLLPEKKKSFEISSNYVKEKLSQMYISNENQ